MRRILFTRIITVLFLVLYARYPVIAGGADDAIQPAALLRVELDDTPIRITGISSGDDAHWLVLTRGGRSWRIDIKESTARVRELPDIPEVLRLDHHEPPEAERTWTFPGVSVRIDDSRFTIRNAGNRVIARGRTLPDARPVFADGRLALLTEPTETYRHGILGDGIEATGFIIYDIESDRFHESGALPGGTVFEARYPIWTDVTEDGIPELLVTTGSAAVGAALRVYSAEAILLAESDAIGTGYRWLHLLGTLPSGPEGAAEVMVVKTPHIGGILESFKLENGRLERTRSLAGYSTHMIRSRNLGMAKLLPVLSDGTPMLLVPTRDYRRLHLLRPDSGSFQLVSEVETAEGLSSNIASVEAPELQAVAWGQNDHSVTIMFLP